MTDIITRDHIVFAVVMSAISAGRTDGLHRGVGVPWWGAVPLGLGTWAAHATLTDHHSQKRMAQAQTPSEEAGA
jgi:hypothetical protein